MHKIQLNKTTKQSSEKKTVLNTIATNSKIIGMQCMQEGGRERRRERRGERGEREGREGGREGRERGRERRGERGEREGREGGKEKIYFY